ncbi:OsmC family protein [Verrucomicrobiaceae bacterium 227]
MSVSLESLQADHVFDGGDMDCGSGLILLIRQQMQEVPVDGLLELRSREPTVADELPPWCRMVKHEFLGSLGTTDAGGSQRHFIRRKESGEETQALEKDKAQAREYTWRTRARSTGSLKSSVYCRNFQFEIGQPASFEEKDAHPSAIEYLLGALAGSLSTAFSTASIAAGLEVDDIEVTVKGRLHNVLAHMGLEEGDPSLSLVEVTGFASSFDEADDVRKIWEETCDRSPVLATFKKACDVTMRLALT